MSARRLAQLHAALRYAAPEHRAAIRALIAEIEIPERATVVDPEPKPPEAQHGAVEGAGRSSETAPAARDGGFATSRPRMPGDTGTAGRAGGAGGSPAPTCGPQRRCEPAPLKTGPLPPVPRPAAPADPKRQGDDEAIARFIAEHGVTRGALAFAAPSQHAALPEAEARRRLAAIVVPDTKRRPGEKVHAWYNRVGRPGG